MGQGQTLKIIGGREAARQTDDELAVVGLDRTCGKFDVFRPQCIFHVAHGEAASRQGVTVEPDAHGIILPAAHANAGNARLHREAIDKKAVGVVGELGN